MSSQQSRISLISSLNDQHEVRRGENVTFLCSTRGSEVLNWTSYEYIGGHIQFSENQMIGTLINPNNYTSAQVTDMYDDRNGRRVIESQLSIIVQRNIRYFSVMCHDDSGQALTLDFQLSGKLLNSSIKASNFATILRNNSWSYVHVCNSYSIMELVANHHCRCSCTDVQWWEPVSWKVSEYHL